MIRIYNSLTNKIEDFKPIHEKKLSIYVCGPTVYDKIHIGNSRPVVFFDTVVRFFKYMGYEVTYVSNFTDIDDKIINKAKAEGTTETEVSERYIKKNLEIYQMLNCLPLDFNPKVTESIQSIIDFIALLVEKGGAYVVDGDVYFDTTNVKDYGILSGQTLENLISGARIETNDKKKNPADFTLWKKTEEGLRWPSLWSTGRPGWHTECVVMINDIFGGLIDIHGGGSDLKFPHHENEISQASCAYNNKIANYWIHNGRVDLMGEKMSKSLGNVVWADELVMRATYQVYRLLLLNVPYRQQINYKEELLAQAKNDFDKIKHSYVGLFRKIELSGADMTDCDVVDEALNAIKNSFIEAMSNDFNTANAITALFNISKFANNLTRSKETDLSLLKQTLTLFKQLLWVLGLDIKLPCLTNEQVALVNSWQQARADKNFELADSLRQRITEENIEL